jgi:hypothetical protein
MCAGLLLEQLDRATGHLHLGLELSDPFLRSREFTSLGSGQAGLLAAVDAVLTAPVVDGLVVDIEIVRHADHAPALGEQIENLASKLGRIARRPI